MRRIFRSRNIANEIGDAHREMRPDLPTNVALDATYALLEGLGRCFGDQADPLLYEWRTNTQFGSSTYHAGAYWPAHFFR